jgi:hypothetical protein
MNLDQHILACLNYFSFFAHPLTKDEVHRYLGVDVVSEDCDTCLRELVERQVVFSNDRYYALNEAHIRKRVAFEQTNQRLLTIGRRVGRLVALFPFVRGVYISGSLSKSGASGEDDDVDFFIITEAKRLWTARMFLILFKKTFLFNSKKYFCVNFFKSVEDLQLSKENRYVATEAMSLIPVVNGDLLQQMIDRNPWMKHELPNARLDVSAAASLPRKLPWVERLLRGKFGDYVEDRAYATFTKHQHKKHHRSKTADITATRSTSAYFPNSVESKLMLYWKKRYNNDV